MTNYEEPEEMYFEEDAAIHDTGYDSDEYESDGGVYYEVDEWLEHRELLKKINEAKGALKDLHKVSYKQLSKYASLYNTEYGVDARWYGEKPLVEGSLEDQYRDILRLLEKRSEYDYYHHIIKKAAINKINKMHMGEVIIELSYTPQAIMTSIDDGGMERMFEQHGY